MRRAPKALLLLAVLNAACLMPRDSLPRLDQQAPARTIDQWRIGVAKGLLRLRLPPGYYPWKDSRFIIYFDSSERILRGRGCRAIRIAQGDCPVCNLQIGYPSELKVYSDHLETISDTSVRVVIAFDETGHISVPPGFVCASYVVSGIWADRDLVFTATTRDVSELPDLLASLRSIHLDTDAHTALQ